MLSYQFLYNMRGWYITLTTRKFQPRMHDIGSGPGDATAASGSESRSAVSECNISKSGGNYLIIICNYLNYLKTRQLFENYLKII